MAGTGFSPVCKKKRNSEWSEEAASSLEFERNTEKKYNNNSHRPFAQKIDAELCNDQCDLIVYLLLVVFALERVVDRLPLKRVTWRCFTLLGGQSLPIDAI